MNIFKPSLKLLHPNHAICDTHTLQCTDKYIYCTSSGTRADAFGRTRTSRDIVKFL